MATHSSVLAWKILWTEQSGRLQSMGPQRVRHYWVASTHINTHTHACIDPIEVNITFHIYTDSVKKYHPSGTIHWLNEDLLRPYYRLGNYMCVCAPACVSKLASLSFGEFSFCVFWLYFSVSNILYIFKWIFNNLQLIFFPSEFLPEHEVSDGKSWLHGNEIINELLGPDLPETPCGLRV